jgi:hypothetical protein
MIIFQIFKVCFDECPPSLTETDSFHQKIFSQINTFSPNYFVIKSKGTVLVKMGLSKEQYLALVLSIRERKDVITGTLSPKLTNRMKTTAWEEVFSEMAAIGCGIKTVTYLRDTVWNNVKRAVKGRVLESRKTGAAGSKLSEFDQVVLDIIGKM